MNNESIKDIVNACLDNISRDEFLDALETEKDKKIGILLYTLGYEEAMDHCTKALELLK